MDFASLILVQKVELSRYTFQIVRFDLHCGDVRVDCLLEFTHLHVIVQLVDCLEERRLSNETYRAATHRAQKLVFEQFCRAWPRIPILLETPLNELLRRSLMFQFVQLGLLALNLFVHDSSREPRERIVSIGQQIVASDA